MKYMILSDLHGSYAAFEKCARAFEAEKADYLVLLGDYLNHGPRNEIPAGYDPPRLAAALNELKTRIIAIRGNCDSEVDGMLLDFPHTADYGNLIALGRRVFLTHGHLWSPEKLPALQEGDIFVSGHTHIPILAEKNGVILVNPGSPSIPKGNSEAGYALICTECVALKSLAGAEIARFSFR